MIKNTFGVILLMVPAFAQAASFDCSRAATFVENTICDDQEISGLDDTLDARYRTAMGNLGAGSRQQLKEIQRAWLAARNKCKDRSCLVNAYEHRLRKICVDYPADAGCEIAD